MTPGLKGEKFIQYTKAAPMFQVVQDNIHGQCLLKLVNNPTGLELSQSLQFDQSF